MSSEYKPHTLIDVATLTGYVPQAHPTSAQFTHFHAQRYDDRPRRSILRRLLSKRTSHLGTRSLMLLASRHPTNSGKNCTLRAKPSSIASGVCRSMKTTVHRSTPPTLTSRMCVSPLRVDPDTDGCFLLLVDWWTPRRKYHCRALLEGVC